jgi:hypothetical protein
MAVAPKLITNREEEDYGSLYQDNFVKRNDPAMLGTKAMNRQISQGVQNTMSGNDVILGDTKNDPETPTTPTTDCPPGYERNAQNICVLIPTSTTVFSDAERTSLSAVEQQKYARMATGYGRSGDLSGAYDMPKLKKFEPCDPGYQRNAEGICVLIESPSSTGNNMRQIIDEEQQRLNQLFTDEERYLNEEFNKYYDDLVRQAEGRAAREGTSPFTGGIARQLEDYMSAAEIEALGKLQMERNRQLTDLRQRKDNIRTQAVRNVLEQKTAEMQTIDQQIQYSQQLAQYVISGSLTLEDANQLADELGLSNTQELIADAVQKQVTAGAFTEEEAKAELENLGIDPNILTGEPGGGGGKDTDIANTAAANQFNEELDSLLGEFNFGEVGKGRIAFTDILAATGAGAATGAIAGAAVSAGVLALPGALIGGVVGMIGGFATVLGSQQINERDLPQLLNPIIDAGIITDSFYNGNSENITVTKSPTANNSENFLDDTYAITVDGKNYSFEGADLLTLAAVLKRAGKNNAEKYPQYQAIFTEANKIYSRGTGSGISELSLESYFGLKRSNAFQIYKKVFNK